MSNNWARNMTRAQDNYAKTLSEMGGVCTVKRRPVDVVSGVQQAAHQVVHSNVPFYVTATGPLMMSGDPFMAGTQQVTESGTQEPRLIEVAMRANDAPVTVEQGDLLVGPQGSYDVKQVASDETTPLSWIVRAEKMDE